MVKQLWCRILGLPWLKFTMVALTFIYLFIPFMYHYAAFAPLDIALIYVAFMYNLMFEALITKFHHFFLSNLHNIMVLLG